MSRRLTIRDVDHDKIIVDLSDGQAGPNRDAKPFRFISPLNTNDLEDLRWYLEDYLTAPFSVYEDRGQSIRGRIVDWGEALFAAVFGPDTGGHDAYKLACNGEVVLSVISRSPAFLGLPWEMLRPPGGAEPLVFGFRAIDRVLLSEGSTSAMPAGPELRILMIIARPSGMGEVGHQIVARRIVECLADLGGRVVLTVLRPPTRDAFERAIRSAAKEKRPYHVIHFDGHGSFQTSGDHLEHKAYLAFETESGGKDLVSADQFADSIDGGRVPIVVLNACRSGMVGKTVTEAALATRVLEGKTASVVAMGYAIYAVAAAEFATGFYGTLFMGGSVSDSVNAGRRRMRCHASRPSPRGGIVLEDWMVPVHYVRRSVRLPTRRRNGRSPIPYGNNVLHPTTGPSFAPALAAVGRFVGRDSLFHQLEAGLWRHHAVLIHGPIGIGKTELAKAFARWWHTTSGVSRPHDILFHRFDAGSVALGPDAVFDEIGAALFGPDFILDGAAAPARRDKILAALSERRTLLVWDNFESVHVPNSPSHQLAPDARWQQAMPDLLEAVKRSKGSALILTSRTEEAWLGTLGRVTVGGLTVLEAMEMSDDVLGDDPDALNRRNMPEFLELIESLHGHPLSLRLLLPELRWTDPKDLIALLKDQFKTWPSERDNPWSILLATLDGVLIRFGDGLAALPALGLFESIVDAQILAAFSRRPEVPNRFAGITHDQWITLLDKLRDRGVLTMIGGELYQLHPAIKAHLTSVWQSEAGAAYQLERSAAELALLDAFAALGDWLTKLLASGEPAAAINLMDRLLRTMLSLLNKALDEKDFGHALKLLQPLDDFWKARGEKIEAQLWFERAKKIAEPIDETLKQDGQPSNRQRLWHLVTSCGARIALESGDFSQAETAYDSMRALLENASGHWRDRQLSSVYHGIGLTHQKRGSYRDAEKWYRNSLAIKKNLNDAAAIAVTSHQIGRVIESRGDLALAKIWYEKSVAIKKDLNDTQGLAPAYHQLAILNHRLKIFDEANEWCLKALAIRQDSNDRPGLAASYHMLGIISYSSNEFGPAENWFRRSLDISTGLGDREALGKIYHQLGMLAVRQERWREAESWYRQSLDVKRDGKDRAGEASTLHQLGNLTKHRGSLHEAVAYYERSLSIRKDLGDLRGIADTELMLSQAQAELDQRRPVDDFTLRGPIAQDSSSAASSSAMFSDPAVPPLRKSVPRRKPVICRFRAEMPAEAALGSSVRLEILISREALIGRRLGIASDEKEAVADERKPIIVQALARLNCFIVGDERCEIEVPKPGAPVPLVFDIAGLEIGAAEVWVEARQGPMTLAFLRLNTLFTAMRPQTAKAKSATSFACPIDAQADYLVLRIFEEERQNGDFRLNFNLDCRNPSINRNSKTADFNFSREKYAASRYAKIERAWIKCDKDHERFVNRMRANGVELYDALVPLDVREDLWAHRHRIKAIQVISEEPFIPWEIAVLTNPKGGDEGGDFLGNLGLVRWMHNIPWPNDRILVRPRSVRFVIPQYPLKKLKLPGAVAEGEMLQAQFPGAQPVGPQSDVVERFLRSGSKYADILHFACHAEAPVEESWDAHLLMTGRLENRTYIDDSLDAAQVSAAARLGDGSSRPLVFLNACQVGRTGRGLGRMGGFAKAFLAPKSKRGAGTFIGALWSVGDAGASRFAAAFYEKLNSGSPLVDAVRHARQEARGANESSWLSYTVYGHPDARMVRQVDVD